MLVSSRQRNDRGNWLDSPLMTHCLAGKAEICCAFQFSVYAVFGFLFSTQSL